MACQGRMSHDFYLSIMFPLCFLFSFLVLLRFPCREFVLHHVVLTSLAASLVTAQVFDVHFSCHGTAIA